MPKGNKHQKNQTDGNQNGQRVMEVTFALERSQAHEVYVCGSFNQWSPIAARMIPAGEKGRWEKRLALPPGRYEYKFVVDGDWIPDPNSREDVVNGFGSINSVLEVR